MEEFHHATCGHGPNDDTPLVREVGLPGYDLGFPRLDRRHRECICDEEVRPVDEMLRRAVFDHAANSRGVRIVSMSPDDAGTPPWADPAMVLRHGDDLTARVGQCERAQSEYRRADFAKHDHVRLVEVGREPFTTAVCDDDLGIHRPGLWQHGVQSDAYRRPRPSGRDHDREGGTAGIHFGHPQRGGSVLSPARLRWLSRETWLA